MSGDFCRVFSGNYTVNVEKFHSFLKFCQRGQNVVRQTDAMARYSNNNREIIRDFCLISMSIKNK